MSLLRDRLGLTALEQLLTERGPAACWPRPPAPRDGRPLWRRQLPGPRTHERDDAGLEPLATQLRARSCSTRSSAQGHPLRLRGVGRHLRAAPRLRRDRRPAQRRRDASRAKRARTNAACALRAAEVHRGGARGRAGGRRSAKPSQLSSLELLYQPIVAVAGSDESQYQVLLRLRDARRPLLPAAEVIPLAERGDFILDIDRWVLMQVAGADPRPPRRRPAAAPVRHPVAADPGRRRPGGLAEERAEGARRAPAPRW